MGKSLSKEVSATPWVVYPVPRKSAIREQGEKRMERVVAVRGMIDSTWKAEVDRVHLVRTGRGEK